MSDEGVSEMLGYAILAGVVITAVICIGSGAGGAITSAAESASFDEACLAIRSFAATASDIARVNDTYYTASEVRVPAGYDLTALDCQDDVARFAVYCANQEIFAARPGSIRLESPFRSVVYEGGAVFGNDSGMISVIRKPSVFIAGGSLYIYLTPVSGSTSIVAGGRPVVLDVRAASWKNISRPAEGTVTIVMTSHCPEGWSTAFREAGFTVEQEGCTVTAMKGGISDVCIGCTTLQVRIE